MQDLKVTLIQTHQYWHDKSANLLHFGNLIEDIKEETDIILLPEMFTTGFSMDASDLYEEMNGESVLWMKQKASDKNAVLIGSLIIKENEKYYNRLIAVFPTGDLKTYDKRHLFRMAKEDETYAAGDKTIIIDYKGWKIKPFVCYDLRFPVWSRNKYDIQFGWAYDVAIYIANWPAVRSHAWKSLAIARAMENQSYVISLNRIGLDEKNHKYSGDSQVINSYGENLLFLDDNEYISTVTLNKEKLDKHRRDFPVGLDADNFNIL